MTQLLAVNITPETKAKNTPMISFLLLDLLLGSSGLSKGLLSSSGLFRDPEDPEREMDLDIEMDLDVVLDVALDNDSSTDMIVSSTSATTMFSHLTKCRSQVLLL